MKKLKRKTHTFKTEDQKSAPMRNNNSSSLSLYETDMVVPLFQEIITNEIDCRKLNHTSIIEEYDITRIIKKTEILQQHSKYALMQQQNHELMANELLALIYYLERNSCCHKMKKSYGFWKRLYFYVTNAVAKIHRVFYYKNNKILPKELYHFSSTLHNQQSYFHKLAIYTTQLSIDNTSTSGCVLIIDKVDEQLQSGVLKGADVSWISGKGEQEFIILPTVCYKWRQMSNEEISGRGWKIEDDVKVYITEVYGPHKINTEKDNELRYIKGWFDNELGFRKIDHVKYFNTFINNGYDSIDSITQIKCCDDLNNIGIVKIGHVKKLLKKIKLLKKYMNKIAEEDNVKEMPQNLNK